MEIPLLQELVIIFGLASLVLLGCNYFRIPTIVGLLLTGIISGPHGLRFVEAVDEVEVLAEIGIVLLLFTIGLEFSLSKLMKSKKQVLVGGAGQVGITLFVTALLSMTCGLSTGQGIFVGCCVALSSTAITLKFLQEKGLVSTSYGRLVVAILIFQDMAAVPMMLIIPLLSGGSDNAESLALIGSLLQGVILIGCVFVGALSVVPRLLFLVARTKNFQLFLLFILLVCFSTAWLTSAMGLSLALGAFLAGLIISESEYSDHAVSHILPFQQVFSSFFFVSVGMLLDLRFVSENVFAVLGATILVLVMKTTVAAGIGRILGYPLRASILAGIGLCQMGEFAFILLQGGMAVSIISQYSYQLLLAVSLFTMITSPFMMLTGPKLVNLLFRIPLPAWLVGKDSKDDGKVLSTLRNHVVIIGFGVCGHHLAWASKLAGVPYAIIELNPETVRSERQNGEPIIFGDATHSAILRRVHVRAAQIAVIAIDDPVATRAIVEAVRKAAPHVYIMVRTRYLKEIEPTLALGADDVVPEEFETSVEIFSRVLTKYLIPENEIQKFCAEARSRQYQIFRSQLPKNSTVSDLTLNIPDFKVEAIRVPAGSSLVGSTLLDSELRARYGANVLMIRRAGEDLSNPNPKTQLEADDLLVVFGEVKRLTQMFADMAPPDDEG